MRKALQLLSATALLAAFTLPTASFAAIPDEDSAVSKNFKQVGRTLRGMRSAKTAEEVADILTKVKKFSVENRKLIPTILDKDSPLMEDYKKGMDNFIAKVDEALKLAQAGDMEGAQKLVKGFRDIKDKAHDHFNVESRR